MPNEYDVIIVGGGAAGLSAGLLLGRARRTVLIFDEGHQRNKKSRTMHGFLSRDGITPKRFLEIARSDLANYSNVSLRRARVIDAISIGAGFELKLENESEKFLCKKLLLATGVIDELPAIPGIDEYFGASVFHCPYCDGFELSDRRLFAYGTGECGRKLALELLGWSDSITMLTDGRDLIDDDQRENLINAGIKIIEKPIAKLIGTNGILSSVAFTDGTREPGEALFFDTESFQKSLLAEKLGCEINERGLFSTLKFESTNIPGLFVAGDASNLLHLVVTAAASGAEAAFAINTQLLKESIALRRQENKKSA